MWKVCGGFFLVGVRAVRSFEQASLRVCSHPGRRLVALIACGLVMVGMVACTQPAPSDGDLVGVGYVEPAWMAEIRQTTEEGNAAWAACVENDGWDVEVSPTGMISTRVEMSEEQEDLLSASLRSCVEEVWGVGEPPTEKDWRLKYSRALDTRDCLVAEGYDISEPPTEDAWVQESLDDGYPSWVPFQEVIDQVLSGEIEMDRETYYALFSKCPQGGPTVDMGW